MKLPGLPAILSHSVIRKSRKAHLNFPGTRVARARRIATLMAVGIVALNCLAITLMMMEIGVPGGAWR